MDDRVATAALAGDPAALADLVGQLRAQMAQLREEIAALKQDNVELRQQAHYWQSQHAQARKQINKLQQRLEKLQAENRNLRQQAFGRRGETSTPSNDETWLAALRDDPPGSRQRGQEAGRPGPARHGTIISICPPASRWLNCRRRSVAAPVVVRPMSSGTIAKTVDSLKSRYTPIAVCCGGDAIRRSAAARVRGGSSRRPRPRNCSPRGATGYRCGWRFCWASLPANDPRKGC